MDEQIEIRFATNLPQYAAESKKIEQAITGVEQCHERATEDMTDNLKIQKRVLRELEQQYQQMRKATEAMAPGAAQAAALEQLRLARQEITLEGDALVELQKRQESYRQSCHSLRTQIMDMRNAMANMTEGTQEYAQAMTHLGELQDRMGDIQAQGRVFADDEKHYRTSIELVQGLSGAMSVGVGVASLFGVSQDKLAAIQTRLQTVMTISIGAQQVAQVLNKDSYVSHILLAGAKNMVTAATTRLTIALGISTVAAKALMATLTLGLSVAITAVVWAIDKMVSSSQQAAKKQEQALQQARQAQEAFNTSLAEGLSKQLTNLKSLQIQWSKLSSEAQKNRFIRDNKQAFDALGVSINTVKDAENLLVGNTAAFVESVKSKAMALAYSNLASKEYEDALKLQMQAEQRLGNITQQDVEQGKSHYNARYDGKGVIARGAITKANIPETIYIAEANKAASAALSLQAQEKIKKVDHIILSVVSLTKAASQKLKDANIQPLPSTTDGGDGGVLQHGEHAQQDYKDKMVELQLQTQQAVIDTMQDGYDKRLQQTALNYHKETLAIAQWESQQKEVVAKAQKELYIAKGGSAQSFRVNEADPAFGEIKKAKEARVLSNNLNKATAKVKAQYDSEIEQHWHRLTSVFQGEERKKESAIKQRYDKEREWAQNMFGGDAQKLKRYQAQIDISQAQEALKELTGKYQTYDDKRQEIEHNYNTEIATLTHAGKSNQAKLAKERMTEELSGLDFTQAQRGADMSQLFGDLDNLSMPSMTALRDKIKAWIDSAGKGLSAEDLKAVSEAFGKLEIKIADKDPFGALKTAITDYKGSLLDIQSAQDKVTKSQAAAQRSARMLSLAQSGVTAAQREYDKALEDNDMPKLLTAQAKLYAAQGRLNRATSNGVATAQELATAEDALTQAQDRRASAVAKAQKAISSAADKGRQIVGAATDVMGILDDLGVKVPEEIAGAINGIGQMMDGLASINLNEPLSIVTGAIKVIGGLVKTITSLINGDNRRQADIDGWQGQIDALSDSYDKLDREISKAYSQDASALLEQQNELLQKQKILIMQQRQAEQEKKKPNDAAMAEYDKRLQEINHTIEDNKQKAIDAIFGADLESAIDNFASAYMDACQGGSDKMLAQKDVVKKMIQGMVKEIIKSNIADKVASLRTALKDAIVDGVISETEQAAIDKLQQEIYDRSERDAKAYDKYTSAPEQDLGNDKSLSSTIQRTMTEATASEFGGIWRGQYDTMKLIEYSTREATRQMSSMALTQMAIAVNTRHTAENTAGLREGLEDVKKELVGIKNNTKQDTGSYGN